MDFYSRRSQLSPVLGLEEGESRKQCPPGTVKSYLPQFPWSECIPEEQALRPYDFPPGTRSTPPFRTEIPKSSVPAPLPPPPPVPPGPPAPPPLPAAPRKARFVPVDKNTGDVTDPETGMVIEAGSAYSIDTVDTIAIGAGIGLVAILLAVAGVFE